MLHGRSEACVLAPDDSKFTDIVRGYRPVRLLAAAKMPNGKRHAAFTRR